MRKGRHTDKLTQETYTAISDALDLVAKETGMAYIVIPRSIVDELCNRLVEAATREMKESLGLTANDDDVVVLDKKDLN